MTNRIARRELVVVFAAAVVLLSMASGAWAAKAGEDIWSDEAPGPESRQPNLTDERIEQLLGRIAKEHPERAEELRKLRKDNPEQFRREIRETFAQRRQTAPRGQGRGGMRGKPVKGTTGAPGMHGQGPTMAAAERHPAIGASGRSERGRRDRWRERIQERHEEYIEWLNKNYPKEAKELVRLREKDPERYIKHVMASRDKYGDIMEAQERNPELAEILKEELELKSERDKLLKEVRTAEGKERKKLMEQLEEIVSRRFDLIVRKKQLRYVHLLEKLKKLQTEVQQREAEVEKLKSKKAQLIKERLEELTSKAEKMNWD